MNWSVKTKAWGPKFKPWNMKIECINSCLTIYFLEATNKQLQGKLFIVQKMGFFWCSNRLHNCCQGYKKHFHSCRTHWCRMLFCETNVQIDKSANYEFFAFVIEVWIIFWNENWIYENTQKIILLQCVGLNHVHLLHFHGFDITPERFSFFNLKVKRS